MLHDTFGFESYVFKVRSEHQPCVLIVRNAAGTAIRYTVKVSPSGTAQLFVVQEMADHTFRLPFRTTLQAIEVPAHTCALDLEQMQAIKSNTYEAKGGCVRLLDGSWACSRQTCSGLSGSVVKFGMPNKMFAAKRVKRHKLDY